MESQFAGPIPAPSVAWGHLVSGEPIPAPVASTPLRRRTDEAAQLRARLLQMIATNEMTRKNAATETSIQR